MLGKSATSDVHGACPGAGHVAGAVTVLGILADNRHDQCHPEGERDVTSSGGGEVNRLVKCEVMHGSCPFKT